MFKKCLLITCMLAYFAVGCMGQSSTPQYKVDKAALSLYPGEYFYLVVHFTDPLSATADADLQTGNIAMTTAPSHPFTIGTFSREPTKRDLKVLFQGTPPTDVTSAQVCFHKLTFADSQGKTTNVTEVCTSPEIDTPATVAKQKESILADLKAVPKTSQEKNIFASGFVTTASGGTDGGVNLNLNSTDLGVPGLTVSMHLNKATASGGDPKSFDAGLNFRSTLLFGKKDLQQIQKDIAAFNTALTPGEQATLLKDLTGLETKKRFWSATLIDFSGRLEGEATNFNVANFVGDGQVQVQSRTQRLFGSRSGFWRVRLVPGGIEGGKNLNSGNSTPGAPQPVDFVARSKAGGQLTMFYENADSPLPFKRFDLDLATVQRYLFLKEAQVSSTGNPTIAFNRGYKPWYQASLKVYFVDSPKGKYGFQLSYNNGSLPPAFSTTKSFQFGFLYETSGGEDKKPTSTAGSKP